MWITNDREMAQTLRAIDVAHAKKRQAASHLPLAQKLMAYKEADEEKLSLIHISEPTRPCH
jgi:hypothetical protein